MDWAVLEALRAAFLEKSFVGAGELFYRLRAVKEPVEVELIRRAGAAACRGMETAVAAVRPGVAELDVLAETERAMLKAGSWGSSFRPQVVSGDRVLLAHPTASSKVIEAAGYGNSYLEFVGYGVGLRQSEFYPIIGRGRPDVIRAGMVVGMLLPTIYRKGAGGPRVTDVIHVGERGNKVLTPYPRDLVRV